MSKHTKVWRVTENTTIVDDNQWVIAKVMWVTDHDNDDLNSIDRGNTLSNARLISCAPEMLEAIKEAVNTLRPVLDLKDLDKNLEADSTILKLIELINKAEGKE